MKKISIMKKKLHYTNTNCNDFVNFENENKIEI